MRRYDLDWLRVLVFGLLIFYHVGMFFVPWSFHLKNNEISAAFELPMRFLNIWRLPLLFLISGMGTAFALKKRSGGAFITERASRLIIPLVVGMIFIIPPQVYVERLAEGRFTENYFRFFPSHAFEGGAYPSGNISWHHLWFLPYLFCYSVVLLPLFIRINRNPRNVAIRMLNRLSEHRFGLYLLTIPLIAWEILLHPFFPTTHALVGDWFCLAEGMTYFLYGFLLIHSGDLFHRFVQRESILNLTISLSAFVLLIASELLFTDVPIVLLTRAVIKTIFGWAMILSVLGFAAKYLNRDSSALRYANQAVYPFYILHQSVMMLGCYLIMNKEWSIIFKFPLLVLITFVGSWIIYECLIRRWRIIRPLFGLKNVCK